MKYYLGIDLGSSFVKTALITSDGLHTVCLVQSPEHEMPIISKKDGWAEQDPELWWDCTRTNIINILKSTNINPEDILSVGISYQMHGLVIIDADLKVLRHAIIWCDSRAVDAGNKTIGDLGKELFKIKMKNYPGNFTASKLRWVRENEAAIFNRIYKFMLPGDYIAFKLTGEIKTTPTGLSEAILWDFSNNSISGELMNYYGFPTDIVPEVCDSFSQQGFLSESASLELGIPAGIPLTYRAGDQPNNAFSLNVMNPGEAAATAGTSGVIYYIGGDNIFDDKNRINKFYHVNKLQGSLLCINGTGILYKWLKNELFGGNVSYEEMNKLAETSPPGSKGLFAYPFGNGAERILENSFSSASFTGIQFNLHSGADIIRASLEAICFAFKYGLGIAKETGAEINKIRAGNSNLFLCKLFREIFSAVTESSLDIYDTNGAVGAAIGASVGLSQNKIIGEAFENFKPVISIKPDEMLIKEYRKLYEKWKSGLDYTFCL
jgi:xylulokinase